MDEFSLIDRIAARTRARDDIALGIGDDCALLLPPPGQVLAVTADTLNAGVHFPAQTLPFDIGWKALAVNLSDLAAMGARPAWCTLALSLPDSDPAWLDPFADGLFALADAAGIAVVGGDTTRGPLSVSITAMGWVPAGGALRRDGARPGQDIWVSGVPGEAALALRLWQGGQLAVEREQDDARLEHLRRRLVRPTPRNALGLALRGLASAAIDISDGLDADLGHLCRRSGVGASLCLDALPDSPPLAAHAGEGAAWTERTAGGDDYELCFTAPEAARGALAALAVQTGVPLARIGRVEAGSGVTWRDRDGRPWRPARPGYNHFVPAG